MAPRRQPDRHHRCGACLSGPPPTSPDFVIVVDVATEAATIVANGRAAIWLDDLTLVVAV
jgi:hypothetical protein